jgi:hypothetical protein
MDDLPTTQTSSPRPAHDIAAGLAPVRAGLRPPPADVGSTSSDRRR